MDWGLLKLIFYLLKAISDNISLINHKKVTNLKKGNDVKTSSCYRIEHTRSLIVY